MKSLSYLFTICIAFVLLFSANTTYGQSKTLAELKSDVSYIEKGTDVKQVMVVFKDRYNAFFANTTREAQNDWKAKNPALYKQMMKENIMIREQHDPNWDNVKHRYEKLIKENQ